jgi:hypothetical protein
MNRGFSLFQGEVACHHLKNDHSAFHEVRKEGSISGSIRAAGTMLQGDIITLKARLHHFDSGRLFGPLRRQLFVEISRDPECDAARALLARGYAGKLTLCDGKAGIPRTIIDTNAIPRH